MNEIKYFLEEKNNKMKKDVFISEAIDNGFRISKKPTHPDVKDPEILNLGFSEEKKKNIIQELESKPQFVLVNTENNMVIELFTINNELTLPISKERGFSFCLPISCSPKIRQQV